MTSRILQTMLTLLLVLGSSTAALALDLDGTVFGFSIGHSWNSIHVANNNGVIRNKNHIPAVNGAIRLGWAWNDNLVGFVSISGWIRNLDQASSPASVTSLNILAELNFYPGDKGSWVRGGLGAGSVDYFDNAAALGDGIAFKESGFAFSFGTGYEYRLTDNSAFGLTYDYTKLEIQNFGNISGANTGTQVIAASMTLYGS